MIHRFAVAIGAGCAAAFLFAVSAQTSPLAMMLAYLAPLPIMIATMGWGAGAGAIAAATSVAGIMLLADPFVSVWPLWRPGSCTPLPWRLRPGFWRLGRLPPWRACSPARSASSGAYASVGSIVTLASAIGILGAGAVLTAVIMVYGGYGEGAKQVAAALAALASDAFDPKDDQARAFAETLVHLGPGRDRGFDSRHAQRQSLCCGPLHAAVASAAKAMARSADFSSSAVAAWRPRARLRGVRLRPARSSLAILLDRTWAGSARRSFCRALRSRTPCRAA